MEDNTFKGSLFGGFNRRDVIHYIEKASRESGELLREKDRQIQELKYRCEDLQGKLLRLEMETSRANASAEELRGDLASARAAQKDSAQTLSQAEAIVREKEYALEELVQRVETLQKEVEDYRAVKNSIAEVEVGAKHRADEIITGAKRAAEELRVKAHTDSEAILAKAQSEAEELRAGAESDAQQIRQAAEDDAAAMHRTVKSGLDNLRKQFDILLRAYTAATAQASSDLEEAMDAIAQMPVVFREVSRQIQELPVPEQGEDE